MRRFRAVVVGLAVVAVVTALSALSALSAGEAFAAASVDGFTINGAIGSSLQYYGSVDLNDTNAELDFGGGSSGVIMRAHTPDYKHVADAELTPATGSSLAVGTYGVKFTADATHVGLDISADGRGCGIASGSITISEYEVDSVSNKVTAFAATYQYVCNVDTVPVTGELRWHSSVDYVAGMVTPNQYSWGSSNLIGLPTAPEVLTVSSDGSIPLSIGAVTLGGSNPEMFAIIDDGCSNRSIEAGQSCTITVVATPMSTSPSALVHIPDNAVGGGLTAVVYLSAQYQDIAMSMSQLNGPFGPIQVGTASSALTIIATSTGTVAATLGTAAITGSDPDSFVIIYDTCSGILVDPGQHCTIRVTANPKRLGPLSARLVLPNNGSSRQSFTDVSATGVLPAAGTYYPLPPARILDTRSGLGAPKAALGPGGVLHLQVTGKGGVASAGIAAVVLNVTVTSPTAASYLAVYPAGAARPTVSSLNFPRGWTGANNVTVPVGAGGKVDIYNLSGRTQVIADVLGFYAADNSVTAHFGYGGQYQPVVPHRLLDTRTPGWGGPLPSHYYALVGVDYGDSLNPHIKALAVNVTATGSSAAGFLTTWNGYKYGLPTASTLNLSPHATVANLAIVPIDTCFVAGCAGLPAIGVYNGSSGSVHVVVDIVGFFDDGLLGDGLTFHAIAPTRIVDTRTGLGAPAAIGPSATASVTTPASVADSTTVALAANVTAVGPTASTYLSIWPADAGISQPEVSTLNAKAGQTVPNAALITVGPAQGFNIFNKAGDTQVLVDVAGVFKFEPLLPSAAAPSWLGAQLQLRSFQLASSPLRL